MDEHRVGLKPILRRVWARKGERPAVQVRPRYEWLYVYAFMCPTPPGWGGDGRDGVLAGALGQQALFTEIVKAFVAKREQAVLLVLDQAGWHVSADTLLLEAAGVLSLEQLPPYSPELMPAERLRELTDEPLANRVFESLAELESVLAERCVSLTEQHERIKSRTLYQWWPGGADHTGTD